MNGVSGMMARALAAALLALGLSVPLAAAEPKRRPFLQDFHAFRFLLHAQGLKPLEAFKELHDDPQKTLFIVFGDTEFLVFTGVLGPYLEHGGALLLATDQRSSPPVEEAFGVRISGEPVHARHPTEAYRRMVECPWISQIVIPLPPFADVDERDATKFLATNRPSSFEPVEARRTGAVRFATTDAAYYSEVINAKSGIFAMFAGRNKSDPPSHQPVLLLPDHSLFINSMMLQDDNGNFRFAQNTVRWASNNGVRSRVLFVIDGEIVTKFEVSPKELPDPTKIPPEHLPLPPVDVLNQVLASWQDDDIFNRLILERFTMNQILSGLTLVVTAGLLVYGCYRLWRGRYLQDVHP